MDGEGIRPARELDHVPSLTSIGYTSRWDDADLVNTPLTRSEEILKGTLPSAHVDKEELEFDDDDLALGCSG